MPNSSGTNNPQRSGSNITGVSADGAQQQNAQAMANAGSAASSTLGGASASSSMGGASATSSVGGTSVTSSAGGNITGVSADDARQKITESMSKAGSQTLG